MTKLAGLFSCNMFFSLIFSLCNSIIFHFCYFYRSIIRYIICYTLIVLIPAQINAVLKLKPFLKLPLNGFTKFVITSQRVYWFGVIYQLFTANVTNIISLTYDSFVAGFMLQLCAQIDILKFNIKSNESPLNDVQYTTIKKLINHHNIIYRYE